MHFNFYKCTCVDDIVQRSVGPMSRILSYRKFSYIISVVLQLIIAQIFFADCIHVRLLQWLVVMQVGYTRIVAIYVPPLDLSKMIVTRICLTQNNIMREAQTMILIDQPNVMKAHCSFTNNHSLWVVMPYMAGGSCLHIMKSVYPDGFEEAVIATVLREVLKGLEYLHHHGHIHRDVKVNEHFAPQLVSYVWLLSHAWISHTDILELVVYGDVILLHSLFRS